MNVVDLEGVSQRYGHTTVLHQLNLSLAEGEVLGLFGHNLSLIHISEPTRPY